MIVRRLVLFTKMGLRYDYENVTELEIAEERIKIVTEAVQDKFFLKDLMFVLLDYKTY